MLDIKTLILIYKNKTVPLITINIKSTILYEIVMISETSLPK